MDEEFIFRIWDDLLFYRKNLTRVHPKKKNTNQENCRVLVFPPMHKRCRFLLHKSVEEFFEGFFSVSIGVNERRRTIICPEYVITKFVLLNETSMSLGQQGISGANKMALATNLDDLTGAATFPEISDSSLLSDKSSKHKRPDRQLYVPRAKRSLTTAEDGSSPDNKTDLNESADKISIQKRDTLEEGVRNVYENSLADQSCKKTNELVVELNYTKNNLNGELESEKSLSIEENSSEKLCTNDRDPSKTDCVTRDQIYNDIKSKRNATVDDDDTRDSYLDSSTWKELFDESYLDEREIIELTQAVGEVEIQRPKYDYLEFRPHDPNLNDKDYSHVVELYDFPAEYKTADLLVILSGFKDKGFRIQWVDDTHALAVFSSSTSANEVLNTKFALLNVRPLTQAIPESKWKAKRNIESVLPYKPRPETSASLARRLVSGALGIKVQIPKEQRERERQKLIEAKESRKKVLNQMKSVSDGNS